MPHQRARWFAMTGLGVRWVWRQRGGSGKLTAGASPRPTVRVSAMHPAQRTRLRSCTRRAGARPRRALASLISSFVPRYRLPKLSLRGAQRRGNPFPRNAQHCTGREAGQSPGPVLRPWRGAQALRLAGERIATPACALVRNDRLGRAVGLEAGAEVPASQRRGQDPRPTGAWPGPGALSIPCTVGRGLAPAGPLQV